MGVPNPPAAIQSIVIKLRDAFTDIDELALWLNGLSLADIEEAYGCDQPTAQIIQSTIGNHESLSQIYKGLASPIQLPFDFRGNGSALWGGI